MNAKMPMLRASSSQVCRQLSLSAEARSLAGDGCGPGDLFQRLRRGSLQADAIRLLPHLMPKRRAVWWGCLCVWQAHPHDLSPEALDALAATVQWIEQPDEANRRACETAAQRVGLETSPGCLAMAAFWSGGSMSRPDLPTVAPPPDLTAKVVGGVVLLAAAEYEPLRLHEHYEQFLLLGEQVARGELPWASQSGPLEASESHLRLHASSAVPPPHWLYSSVVAAVSCGGRHQQHRHVER
jgi:hypothetical protein